MRMRMLVECGYRGGVAGSSLNGKTYILTTSSCAFLGMMASICGASRGYVSQTLLRTPRCMDDLSFVFAPGATLVVTSSE